MDDGNRGLVERIFERAAFVRALGIELTACGKGWCETRLQLKPTHLQQHGLAHAGVVMTMADHTCGGAAGSSVPEGKDVITVENKTSFLRPASGTELACRARPFLASPADAHSRKSCIDHTYQNSHFSANWKPENGKSKIGREFLAISHKPLVGEKEQAGEKRSKLGM